MANQQILHILKRLALGVPALFIITSVVFLLSKAMPGNSGTYLLEHDGGGISPLADEEERENIYRTYLQRTGQDKPLFYVALSSMAEPDTLYKIFPEKQRDFVKQLCFAYGDWRYVHDYYQSLKRLQAEVSQGSREGYLQPIVERLMQAVTEAEVREVLYLLTVEDKVNRRNWAMALQSAQASFEQMLENRKPYRKLVPVLRWNGKDNQYHAWLTGLFKGEMGFSFKGHRSVSTLIGEAIGVTLFMSITALCMGWGLALVLGLVINLPACRKIGRPLMSGLYVLDTVPLFLLSFLLLIVFSATGFQGALPAFGMEDYAAGGLSGIGSLLNQLALPIVCMTLAVLPYITAQVDRAVKEELAKEHVKTAYAKGLTDFAVLKKHVLNNAWVPLITLFTSHLPAVISGAVVVEVIFAIPGMGRLLVHAVSGRDYPVILGVIFIVAAVKILANILADILYAIVDPRIKIGK